MNTWQTKKLEEVLSEISDGNYSSKYPRPQDFVKEGVPFIRAVNFKGGRIVWDGMRHITSEKHAELKKGHLKINDILITTRGEIGNTAFVTSEFKDANINAQIVRLQPNPSEIIPLFLFYLLNSQYIKSQFYKITTGSTLKQLSIQNLHLLKVHVPSLSTQQQIVEKLDAIRKLQELNNKEIEKAEELFETQLSNCFKWQKQWEKIKLAEICDVRDGTHDSPKYQPSGIPLITSKNLKEDSIDFTNINYISEKDHQQIIKRSFVENGDILFGMIGTIGNPVIVDTERTFSIKNVGLIKFPNRKRVNNLFVKYFLQSPLLEIEIKRLSRGGTQKFVSLGNLRNLLIPLPSLKEQEKIAMELNNIRLFKSQLNLKEVKLSELFESTLNKAMKGELV